MLVRIGGALYDRSEEIRGQFNMARRIPGKEVFNKTIRYFLNKIKKLEMGGKLTVQLKTNITYGDMERIRSPSFSTSGGVEGEGSKGVDWWILATGVEPRITPIPGLYHPNVVQCVDVLRRDANVGNRFDIIGVGVIGFDARRWMED